MVDLSATYGGVRIKNPLISASGPNTHTPEVCERNAQAGWAAVVLKTCHTDLPEWKAQGGGLIKAGSPMMRLYDFAGRESWKPIPPKRLAPKVREKKGKKLPPYSTGLIPHTTPAYYKDPEYIEFYYEAVKRCEPYDCKVIPSIFAASFEGWERLCKMINTMNPLPPAVELCLGMPLDFMGAEMPEGLRKGVPPACEPDVCERFVKFCVDHLDVPVIAKLVAMEYRNGDVAVAVQRAGAKGINLGNSSVLPSMRIDIETAMPGGHPDFPILSECSWGAWVVPYNCGAIYQMRSLGITIDIAATGGVYEIQDIIRYIMAGANVVQACRVVMIEGFDIGNEWLEGVSQWMEKRGYTNIDKMRGIVINKVLTDPTKLPRRVPQRIGGPPPHLEIVLNEKKCIDCGWCEKACMDLAIKSVGGLPRIDKKKCEVCGLCEAICPVHALKMEPAR